MARPATTLWLLLALLLGCGEVGAAESAGCESIPVGLSGMVGVRDRAPSTETSTTTHVLLLSARSAKNVAELLSMCLGRHAPVVEVELRMAGGETTELEPYKGKTVHVAGSLHVATGQANEVSVRFEVVEIIRPE